MDLTGPMPIGPGRQLGHYTILSRLGEGGMGEVYLALDRKLERQVAMKILSSDFGDHDRLHLLQREARALAALNHPNIVTIYSVEDTEHGHLLVMEFVQGRTLRDVLRPGGLALEQFFEIAIPLCDALAVAHQQGVTHRDLKPENVMLTETGRLKVLDFGLAKMVHSAHPMTGSGSSAAFTIAAPGAVLGTLGYLSPEQANGQAADSRSDIFSLGIVLYELATGRRPFEGNSAAHVIASILRDEPAPVEQVRPDAPVALGNLIRRCLHKDPEQRVHSARELHEELQLLAAEMLGTGAPGIRRRTGGRVSSPVAAATPLKFSDRLLGTRSGLTALLALVFVVNLIETTLEHALQASAGVGTKTAHAVAQAQRWLEAGLSFERHDLTSLVGVYSFSIAYFFVLPLMLLALLIAFARRPEIRPYRVMCLTLTATYAISLVFYLFFPVPERWAFPESEAVLLSDLWTSWLITAVRPVSGLDNCFPSFHVASSVDCVLLAYAFRIRFRSVVVFLSSAVLLSTFALGIHWLPDIIAGLCLGVISLWAAIKFEGSRSTTSAPRVPASRAVQSRGASNSTGPMVP